MLSRQLGQLTSRFTDSERQERKRPHMSLLCKQSTKPKKSGERDTKYKSGTLACLPYTQFRIHWRGSRVLLLLQADSLQLRRRSKSRGKIRATFSEQGRVEGLVFGGS